MSFDNDHSNRKDHRKPYRKAKRWDRSCRNQGSCGYCRDNREHSIKQREQAADRAFNWFGLDLAGILTATRGVSGWFRQHPASKAVGG